MRALAIIFSAVSLYYLFRLLANSFGLIPLGGGFEGWAIVFIGDCIIGNWSFFAGSVVCLPRF
jgi:hypothetical protein